MADFDSAFPQTDDPAADFLNQHENDLGSLESPRDELTHETNGFDLETDLRASPVNGDVTSSQVNGGDAYTAIAKQDVKRSEPEKIRQWREDQAKKIAEKDAKEMKDIEEWKVRGAQELEDWQKHYDEQLEKTKKQNREAEEESVKAIAAAPEDGAEWDKVSKLVDFNPKANKHTKDVSKMRSLMLQLKH